MLSLLCTKRLVGMLYELNLILNSIMIILVIRIHQSSILLCLLLKWWYRAIHFHFHLGVGPSLCVPTEQLSQVDLEHARVDTTLH